jgi:alkanesulfonate monooxygenase SsuD/methylene tetrahydromethanopterin reductase-like flavin-dependent oxidoreductase (luciferase family)
MRSILRRTRSNVRFGAHYHTTYLPELDGDECEFYDHLFGQMELLDRLGYDDVWVTEHHFSEYGGMISHPPTFLAAVARTTKRIRLGTAVSVIPVQHPIQAAEAYAMVDVISHGRLEFGVGRGNNAVESDAFGKDFADSTERMRAAVELILRTWAEGSIPWDGRTEHHEQLRVLPKPIQKPHPPVWVAASREDSFRWAGENGFNIMTLPSVTRAEDLRAGLELYHQALIEAGYDPLDRDVLGKFHIYVADSEEAALREAIPYYDNYRRISGAHLRQGDRPVRSSIEEQIAKGDIIIGNPSQCIELIQRWRDLLGLTCISGTVHFGGMPHELALKNISLFAAEVMPAFNRTAAGVPALAQN